MLYASLKAAHLLAVVVWLGGMFFTLVCLAPAAAALAPPERLPLLHGAMRRFLDVVAVAAAVVLTTGATMILLARVEATRAGLVFNMPLDWYVMTTLFFVMLFVYLHIRFALFARLGVAVAGRRWPDGGAALGAIRVEVILNLVLGVFIVVLVRLGASA